MYEKYTKLNLKSLIIIKLLEKPMSFKELALKIYPKKFIYGPRVSITCKKCNYQFNLISSKRKENIQSARCPGCRRKYIVRGANNYQINEIKGYSYESDDIRKELYSNLGLKNLKNLLIQELITEKKIGRRDEYIYSINFSGLWKELMKINKGYVEFVSSPYSNWYNNPNIQNPMLLMINNELSMYSRVKNNRKAKAQFYGGGILEIINIIICGIGKKVHNMIKDERKTEKLSNNASLRMVFENRYSISVADFLLNCMAIYLTSITFFRDLTIETHYDKFIKSS